MGTTGLRNAAIFTFVVSLAILLVGGHYAKDQVRPIPETVKSDAATLTDGARIMRGQAVYQRYGLMDHGSVWGHGSLRGMDFSAYTLHCVGHPDAGQLADGAGPDHHRARCPAAVVFPADHLPAAAQGGRGEDERHLPPSPRYSGERVGVRGICFSAFHGGL